MTPNENTRAHEAAVKVFLRRKYGRAFDRHDREELTQEAFVGLQVQRRKGEPIRNVEALLIACAKNAAKMRLRAADRRRRHPFDPHDGPETRLPDAGPSPDVAVIEADEDRRVRRLIDQLDDRARAIVKLRIDADMPVAEIADHLGITRSHTNKLLKQAGSMLGDSITASRAGAYSSRDRSLLAACVLGIATAQQRQAAERLLDDPAARATLKELRRLGDKAAAALPMPAAATVEQQHGRLTDAAGYVADTVRALAGRLPGQEAATQISAAGGFRGAGTAAALVASCVGVAFGTRQCVVHGIPTIPGIHASSDAADAAEPQHENEPKAEVRPLSPTTPDPVSTVPHTDPDPASSGNQDPTPPATGSTPVPAPASSSDSLSGLSGDPAAPAAPAPAAPAPSAPQQSGGSAPSSGATAPPFGGGLG